MAKQQNAGLILPVNFLLTCDDNTLASHELALLAELSDRRADLHVLLDRIIDTSSQVSVVRWFRKTDRQALKHAIENEESPLERAQRIVRDGQRTEEELIPLPALEPGAAHLAASLRYQKRNRAEGKCICCPEPLAHNSVTFCEKHLRAQRLRYKPKNAKGAPPGSVGYLYGEGFESQHGRTPGTLQSLAMNREKKSRAILAELGLPAGSAATALQAAKEALLAQMPRSQKHAATALDLFGKAGLLGPIESTAKHALQALAATGQVQRIGRGIKGDPYLYFVGGK